MIQVVEKLKVVQVGILGNTCAPAMIKVWAYQGEETGKFYGIIVDECKSGDCFKQRKIMFGEIDTLEKIAHEFSNKQEESRTL